MMSSIVMTPFLSQQDQCKIIRHIFDTVNMHENGNCRGVYSIKTTSVYIKYDSIIKDQVDLVRVGHRSSCPRLSFPRQTNYRYNYMTLHYHNVLAGA